MFSAGYLPIRASSGAGLHHELLKDKVNIGKDNSIYIKKLTFDPFMNLWMIGLQMPKKIGGDSVHEDLMACLAPASCDSLSGPIELNLSILCFI